MCVCVCVCVRVRTRGAPEGAGGKPKMSRDGGTTGRDGWKALKSKLGLGVKAFVWVSFVFWEMLRKI